MEEKTTSHPTKQSDVNVDRNQVVPIDVEPPGSDNEKRETNKDSKSKHKKRNQNKLVEVDETPESSQLHEDQMLDIKKNSESSSNQRKTDRMHPDAIPKVSFATKKRPGLTKRVSLNTRKTMQRQGSVSQFMKEYMLTSGDKDAIFHDISENNLGTLQFTGYDNNSGGVSPFVKVPYKTHPIRVWEIMTERWKCSIPNLIIAVTGGTSSLSIGPKLKEKFKRGLIKAAATTGAWIITNGTKSGIMEYVGKSVKDHVISSGGHRNIVTLGIASWDAIYKSEGLIKKTKGHSTQSCITYEKVPTTNSDIETRYLDNNHTHFILVDDESKKSDEVGFETKFENFLSGTVQIPGARTETDGSQIPLIRILIDGGFSSLKTILGSLRSVIPVIVLDGSGSAASLITEICGKADKLSDSDIRNMVTRPDYKMMLKDEQIEPCVNMIKEIIGNKAYLQMLNIFHVNEFETKDFDKVILESLLKARESNAIAKLLVSLAWNRSDIAEKQIFTTENRENLKAELNNFMVMALIQNKHQFVRLLIEQGVDLESFFNIRNLWNLYSNCLLDTTDKAAALLNNLITFRQHTLAWYRHLPCFRQIDIAADHRDLLIAVGDAVEYLLQDEVMNPYPEHKDFQVDLQCCEMGYIEDNPDEHADDRNVPEIVTCATCQVKHKLIKRALSSDYRLFNGPEMQLFLWALLFNRIDMAKIFWNMIPCNKIVAAVLASSVLKAFNKYAKKEESFDLSESLKQNSSYFEQLACDVMTECYTRDGDMAQKLLVQKVDCTTLLMLAEDHHLTEFMGHPCVQQKLNVAWKGRIALYTSALKILINMLLPILVFDMKFTDNGKTSKPKQTKQDSDEDTEQPTSYSSEKSKSKERKFYRVSLFGDRKGKTISLGFALYYLYRAPIAIFMANVISYLVFLGMFSYFVMTELSPGTLTVVECLCYCWIITSIIEEIREILFKKQKSLSYKLYKWFGNEWNRFDLVIHICFVLSVILRLSLNENYFIWARIVYSFTLSLSFLRFMEVFYAEERMGPKVIMIRKMLADLLFFILILALFMLSFGTAYQANLFPNAVKDWKLLKDVLYIPYFQIYGEIFLDNMEGTEPTSCTNNETQWRYGGATRCAESNPYVIILLVAYMMLTNILLVNLVIAMFSHTFQKVQADSKKIWRFHRFSLVHGYYIRPMLVPPFIILTHIFRFIRWIMVKYCKAKPWANAFRMKFDDDETYRLTLFEKDAAGEYMHQINQLHRQKIENKIDSTVDRIEQSTKNIDMLRELVTRNENIQTMQIRSNYDDIREMKKQLTDITATLSRLENHILRKNT